MSAKQQAIEDIRKELKGSKAFIAFRRNLNPIMDSLVNEYLNTQKSLTKKSNH